MKFVINKFRRSIFTRLFVIFMITGFLLMAACGYVIKTKFKQHVKGSFSSYVNHYCEYILKDIGIPPDTSKAKFISKKINIDIAISGPEIDWSSSPTFTDYNIEYHKVPNSRVYCSNKNPKRLVKISNGPYDLFFYHRGQDHPHLSVAHTLIFFSVIGLILGLCYLTVRWLLKPIGWVKEGADKIGSGELSYRLPTSRHDEIGELSGHINSMADDIQKMLEAKRQLLLAISHELRTPLTRMRISSEFIEKESVREDINQDIREMDQLIGDLIEGEKLNQRHVTLNKNLVDLNSWIKSNLYSQYKEGEINYSLPELDIKANIDPIRFRLLLKNLMDNAVRHTTKENLPVNFKLTKENNTLIFSIEDKGEGIPKEDLEKITQPFYRVDSSRTRETGGYGLGLYLSKLIAEAHKGTLKIKSTLGQGTSIEVTIPL